MSHKYMKRCWTLLIIREMQSKTTMRYHLIPIRMAITIEKVGDNECWQRCGGKETLICLLVGMWTGAATMENSTELPQKVKNRNTSIGNRVSNTVVTLYGDRWWRLGWALRNVRNCWKNMLYTVSQLYFNLKNTIWLSNSTTGSLSEENGGTWAAQSVKPLTLGFSFKVMISTVMG